jgi:hypothetical protein
MVVVIGVLTWLALSQLGEINAYMERMILTMEQPLI